MGVEGGGGGGWTVGRGREAKEMDTTRSDS